MRHACLAALATMFLASVVRAETHVVQVGDASFDPPALEVSPGDLVRFQIVGGFGTVRSGFPCRYDGVFTETAFPPFSQHVDWEVPVDLASAEVPFHAIIGNITCDEAPTAMISVVGGGAVITVPEDHASIQAAIDVAADGDTIVIAAGTYFEHDLVIEGKGLTIRGALDERNLPATTIDAGQQGRVLSISTIDADHATVLGNLVLTGGLVDGDGAGLQGVFAPGWVMNCRFTANDAMGRGGGVHVEGASPLFGACRFDGNTAGDSAGFHAEGVSATLAGCVVDGNVATTGIIGGVGHAACGGGGKGEPPACSLTIDDSIVCGNRPDQAPVDLVFGSNSCFKTLCADDADGDGMPDDCTDDADGILQVPGEYPSIGAAIDAAIAGQVVSIAAGTYLEHDLDVGDKSITITGAIDAFGEPAVVIDAERQGRVMEISGGAGVPALVENLVMTGGLAYDGGGLRCGNRSVVVRNCLFIGNEATNRGGGVHHSTAGDFAATFVDCRFIENIAGQGGGLRSHFGTVELFGAIFCGNVPDQMTGSIVLDETSCATTSCEDDDDDGIPDGCVVEDDGVLQVPSEYSTIQLALAMVRDGETILIAEGEYPLEGRFGLTFDLTDRSFGIVGSTHADGTPATVIEGGATAHDGFDIHGTPDDLIEISNLKITGCFNPVVIRKCRSSIRNCVIEGNRSGYGAVWSLQSQSELVGCTIRGNQRGFGGGVCLFDVPPDSEFPASDVTLRDCLIEGNLGNYLDMGVGIGGIAVLSGQVSLVDCVVRANVGPLAGGVSGSLPDAVRLAGTTVCGNSVVGDDEFRPSQVEGPWTDDGGNTIVDECPNDCPGDLDWNGRVDAFDLAIVLGYWGTDDIIGDINLDGIVDAGDLGLVITDWGSCP